MHKHCALSILAVICGLSAVSAQGGTENGCVLPEYPENGRYTVYNKPEASPGQSYDLVVLQLTCEPGYMATGNLMTFCLNNTWSQPLPQCIRFCKLVHHESVTYRCKVTGAHGLSGTRRCEEHVPQGTVVVPECRRPVYNYNGVLRNMYCIDGFWDHVAICQPECGTPTPMGMPLIFNGSRAERGELPWHAGIYDKGYSPYLQICGGSLISTTVVISAAHCFWQEGVGLRQHSNYAVALGKIYRPWNVSQDFGAHKSDVSDIRVPVRFMGEEGNFQDDIALVIMTTPVVYVPYIKPVCLDFNDYFDNRQLQQSNLGKVAGWGLTAVDGAGGRNSPVLRTTQLPYVDVQRCIADLPPSLRSTISSDKICAGTLDGNTNLCRGDNGGGLVFPAEHQGIQRYYLRGVMSAVPVTDHRCSLNTYATFTHVLNHATFIKDLGLGADGRRSYSPSCDMDPVAAHCATTERGPSGPSGQVDSHAFDDRETRSNQGTEVAAQDAVSSQERSINKTVPERPLAPDVCAPLAADITTPPQNITSWDRCLDYQREAVYPCEESTPPLMGKVRGNNCRHRNVSSVLGKVDAERDEFPHMALLGYRDQSNETKWLCGGTIISERFILTVVDCTRGSNPNHLHLESAMVGILKRTDGVDSAQVHRIISRIEHPNYRAIARQNDIALIKTETTIRFSPSVVPACLDVFGDDHATAVATGWGATLRIDGPVADRLKKVTLTKFTDRECRAKYPPKRHGAVYNDTIQVCYGDYEQPDYLCRGDSGGPLTVHNHRLHCMYTVVAIISYGRNCGIVGVPSYYTRVAPYVPWIESIVWP